MLPDGRLVTSSGGMLRIWSVDRPGSIYFDAGVARGVNGMAVTPDGLVVTVGDDGRVQLWNTRRPVSDPIALAKPSGCTRSLCFPTGGSSPVATTAVFRSGIHTGSARSPSISVSTITPCSRWRRWLMGEWHAGMSTGVYGSGTQADTEDRKPTGAIAPSPTVAIGTCAHWPCCPMGEWPPVVSTVGCGYGSRSTGRCADRARPASRWSRRGGCTSRRTARHRCARQPGVCSGPFPSRQSTRRTRQARRLGTFHVGARRWPCGVRRGRRSRVALAPGPPGRSADRARPPPPCGARCSRTAGRASGHWRRGRSCAGMAPGPGRRGTEGRPPRSLGDGGRCTSGRSSGHRWGQRANTRVRPRQRRHRADRHRPPRRYGARAGRIAGRARGNAGRYDESLRLWNISERSVDVVARCAIEALAVATDFSGVRLVVAYKGGGLGDFLICSPLQPKPTTPLLGYL